MTSDYILKAVDALLYDPSANYPALARCNGAWFAMTQTLMGEDEPERIAAKAAQAYRNAMPPLVGAHNIRDFIACTAQGMLMGVIDSACGARLLYAAQVAHATRRVKSTPQKALQEPVSAPKKHSRRPGRKS